jgi:uncharacterized protein YkwD
MKVSARGHRWGLTALAAGLCLAAGLIWLLGALPRPAQGQAVMAGALRPGDTLTQTVYLPVAMRDYPPMTVDPASRAASLEFYQRVYLGSEGVAIGWTGSHASCTAGTTAAAFRAAVQLRINYFRAMAGVPSDLVLNATYTGKAQQAALMMSANGTLSHDPPSSWTCYTAAGDEAAHSSNLCLGCYGPGAIDAYMEDFGDGNTAVGHRRWVLYPQTQEMGTGDIPWVGGYWAANALWVFDSHMWEPRPPTREEYVAWPPPGYVPYQVVYPRWSFSYAGADFGSATVSMSSGGSGLGVSLQTVKNGYGENTLVWEPAASFGPPGADTTYSVSVSNVKINGSPRSFAYDVVVFDPATAARTSAAEGVGPELGSPPELP